MVQSASDKKDGVIEQQGNGDDAGCHDTGKVARIQVLNPCKPGCAIDRLTYESPSSLLSLHHEVRVRTSIIRLPAALHEFPLAQMPSPQASHPPCW